MTDDADVIWNRATTTRALTAPGDRALQALFAVHGQVMNGGLLSALDYVEPEDFARGADGCEFFGLDDVAALLRRAYAVAFPEGPLPAERRELHTMELPEAAHEELEALDDRYAELLSDARLETAFRRRLAERPDAFAPVD